MTKLALGQSPLEQRAIEAHAARLGIAANIHRTIERHAVRGGDAAIVSQPVLDLAALAEMQRRLGIDALRPSFGGVTASVAEARFAGIGMAFEGATKTLPALAAKIGGMPDGEAFESSRRLASRLDKLASDFDQVLSGETLAHARPADLDALRSAFTRFRAAVDASRPQLAAEGIVPLKDALATTDRILDHAALFETSGAFVTTKSESHPLDDAATALWAWSIDRGAIAGPALLTMADITQFARDAGISEADAYAARDRIDAGEDVFGRTKQWAAENEKPLGTFFFTLSEREAVARDIGASPASVTAALMIADVIGERNAAR